MAKKKKKKQQEEQDQLNFEMNFSDITMVEASGIYLSVKEIMEEDEVGRLPTVLSGGRPIQIKASKYGPYDWCIKTQLSVLSDFGECRFMLDFYHDGRVYILGYAPSPSGVYTTDLGCLTRWCQVSGWKIPQPTEILVKGNLEVWKRIWNTLLVDSDYLDNRFGIRPALDIRNNPDAEEDEIDELD